MTYNILFTFNRDQTGGKNPLLVECSHADTIHRIYLALQSSGHRVYKVNLFSPQDLRSRLARLPAIDFVFNIAEGFLQQPRTMYDGSGPACIKDLFEQLDLPVSHSGPQTMIKCRNKQLTNLALRRTGVPTPHGFVIYDPTGVSALQDLQFPVFVKPLSGGNSLGIDEGSIVDSYPRLVERVQYLQGLLKGAGLLVEEYLPGPEYTVAVVGNNPLIALPPVSFRSGAVRSTPIKRLGTLGSPIQFVDRSASSFFELTGLAVKSFKALEAADVIRVDIKENERGEKFVIDVNGTPSLGAHSSLYWSARHLGLNFQQLVSLLLASSLRRYGLPWGEQLTCMMAAIKNILERYYPPWLPAEGEEQVL